MKLVGPVQVVSHILNLECSLLQIATPRLVNVTCRDRFLDDIEKDP
jgi:hypothetical protein